MLAPGQVSSTASERDNPQFAFLMQDSHEEYNPKKVAIDPEWKDKTFLIVEDVPSNFQLLAAYLSRTGANVIHFDRGMPAFEWIKAGKPIDMILMDLRLPDMNGIAVTRMIRNINSRIPVIAQTAFAMQGDRERCLDAGCNDYIAKPIRKSDFLELVTRHLS
ncbi:MAG: response regulator [Bacteroidales bacterium]|nr:response regulator [Bacteroidales bacterium]